MSANETVVTGKGYGVLSVTVDITIQNIIFRETNTLRQAQPMPGIRFSF
jgi:hypothetical protein